MKTKIKKIVKVSLTTFQWANIIERVEMGTGQIL